MYVRTMYAVYVYVLNVDTYIHTYIYIYIYIHIYGVHMKFRPTDVCTIDGKHAYIHVYIYVYTCICGY
jgi:hypothetical protein